MRSPRIGLTAGCPAGIGPEVLARAIASAKLHSDVRLRFYGNPELLLLGAKRARLYRQLRTKFLEKGDGEALAAARALIEQAQNLPLGDRERLFGYIEGGGKMILTEPRALLTTKRASWPVGAHSRSNARLPSSPDRPTPTPSSRAQS